MIPYMFSKLGPNPTHSTRGLVKYVPGRGYFRAVPSQNGDKFVTSPTPSIVERVLTSRSLEGPLRNRLNAIMRQVPGLGPSFVG